MSSERPETIAERLLAVADWLDMITPFLLRIDWEKLTGSSDDAAQIVEHLAGTEIQEDLRIDAATIDAMLTAGDGR